MTSCRIQDPTHLAHCLEITFKDVFFDDLSNPLSYDNKSGKDLEQSYRNRWQCPIFHDLRTNFYRIESLGEEWSASPNFSCDNKEQRKNKSLPAWHLLLPSPQKKPGKPNSFMFGPKSTTVLTAFLLQQDGNPQKKLHRKTSDGFSEEFFLFFICWWWECWKVLEDGIWNPRRCFWLVRFWFVVC